MNKLNLNFNKINNYLKQNKPSTRNYKNKARFKNNQQRKELILKYINSINQNKVITLQKFSKSNVFKLKKIKKMKSYKKYEKSSFIK